MALSPRCPFLSGLSSRLLLPRVVAGIEGDVAAMMLLLKMSRIRRKSKRRRSCDDAPSGYVHSKSSKTDADNVGHADELIQPRVSRDALSNHYLHN